MTIIETVQKENPRAVYSTENNCTAWLFLLCHAYLAKKNKPKKTDKAPEINPAASENHAQVPLERTLAQLIQEVGRVATGPTGMNLQKSAGESCFVVHLNL